MKKRTILMTVGIIFFIALFLRVVNLSADPINIEFLATRDEGLYSYSSRSQALFGQWQTDNFNYGRIMPVFPPLQLIGVKLFGIQNYSFRFISVISSLITVIVLYWFLKKEFGIKPALLGSFLLSFNFMYLVFSRSGLPEVTMIFFSLLSFINYFYVLIHRSNGLRNAILSGVFFMLAFFTKQSMIILIAVYAIIAIYLFFNDYKKFRTLLFGFSLPVAVILLIYYQYFYLSNPKEWYENYLATINIHRFRRAFLTWSYLQNQIKEFVFSDYWRYVIILYAPIFIGFVYYIARLLYDSAIQFFFTRESHPSTSSRVPSKVKKIVFASSLWLFSFLLHMLVAPGKFGRFYLISIIPLTILFSYFYSISKKNIKHIYNLLFIIYLIINSYFIFKYIILNSKYTYITAVKKLNMIIRKDQLANLPPHWIMNGNFKTVNPFLISPDDKNLFKFYNRYGWPKYTTILDYQVEMYKKDAPIFLSKYRLITKINDYYIYKIKEK